LMPLLCVVSGVLPFCATWVVFTHTDTLSLLIGWILTLMVSIITSFHGIYFVLAFENWAWMWPAYLAPAIAPWLIVVAMWFHAVLSVDAALVVGFYGSTFFGSVVFLLTMSILVEELMYANIRKGGID